MSTTTKTDKAATANLESSAKSDNSNELKYFNSDAKGLLEAAESLLKAEHEMVEKAYEYVQERKLGKGFIGHLNGFKVEPSWLKDFENGTSGIKHSDTREIQFIRQLQVERNEAREAFTEQVGELKRLTGFTGANADNAVKQMRSLLLQGGKTPQKDEILLSMINALGQNASGQDASMFLLNLAYPGNGDAFLNGIDKKETSKRVLNELIDSGKSKWDSFIKTAKQKAEDLYKTASDKVAALTADDDKAASTTTITTTDKDKGFFDKLGDWFSEKFSGMKDKAGNWKFGGIAGSLGVGGLFYMIGNALGGNSWFGKIVGAAIGIFGAVMGYKLFAGETIGGSNAAGSSVSHVQPQGRVTPAIDPATLRNNTRSLANAQSAVGGVVAPEKLSALVYNSNIQACNVDNAQAIADGIVSGTSPALKNCGPSSQQRH
jgi:hypothetical protein